MIEFEGKQIPPTLREVVDPKRTILLVWDMQNDQAGASFNKEQFLRATPPLIRAAKKAGLRGRLYSSHALSLERRITVLHPQSDEGSERRSSEQAEAAAVSRELPP